MNSNFIRVYNESIYKLDYSKIIELNSLASYRYYDVFLLNSFIVGDEQLINLVYRKGAILDCSLKYVLETFNIDLLKIIYKLDSDVSLNNIWKSKLSNLIMVGNSGKFTITMINFSKNLEEYLKTSVIFRNIHITYYLVKNFNIDITYQNNSITKIAIKNKDIDSLHILFNANQSIFNFKLLVYLLHKDPSMVGSVLKIINNNLDISESDLAIMRDFIKKYNTNTKIKQVNYELLCNNCNNYCIDIITPCSHNICLVCLYEFFIENGMKCPICKLNIE
jgi:hypothetical protein